MKNSIIIFTLILGTVLSFGQVPTIERDALIALYNSTDGANWWDNTNWNTAEPVSTWYGITVENISGHDHVTEIVLWGNNLNGSLISEFENLPELRVLYLSDNSGITGPIPSELGYCVNLINITIAFGNITGSIPSEFANLTNLEELIFDFNWMSGEIPDVLNSMNLKALGLMYNDFTGSINVTNTNHDFYYLNVAYNLFSEIDFRNGYNTNIVDPIYFQANDSPNLTCIFVDDATYSSENWTYVDETATFVETQAECDALLSMHDEVCEQFFELFPNPTSGVVSIESEANIVQIDITNRFGQLVLSNADKSSIDMTTLAQGLYILKITDENGNLHIEKVLKE